MKLLRRLPADELRELVTLQMRNTSQILRYLEANEPNAAKQVLQELAVDQRLEGLAPKVVATSLPIEARLEGVDAAHALLAMPNEVLRALSPEYIASLPNDVQARIRERLAK